MSLALLHVSFDFVLDVCHDVFLAHLLQAHV